MKIKGVHHIKLTVADLERSKQFYENLPGFKIVASYPDFLMFSVGNVNLGLTTHEDKRTAGQFNEFNVGLDHLAFNVVSDTGLDEAITFLDDQGIEHSEVKALSNGVHIVAFRDPDNVQLEFAWKPDKP